MVPINNSHIRKIAEAVDADIVGQTHLADGHNAILRLLDMDDGRRLVVKQACRATGRLDLEGWMLRYLAEHTDLPVPRVYLAEEGLLVMDYIADDGRGDASVQDDAAEKLAALHGITARQYGLERDTLIGPLDQPNTPNSDWIDFLAERRIGYMARKAYDEGRIDKQLLRNIDHLLGRLAGLIGDPGPPSLIHGDLWQGNVLCCHGRISGFIDPAIYYADAEIELAFSTLFGTFSEPFFRKYHALRPIRDGFFEHRRDLYNLYPLLVHVRLYGGAYVRQVDGIVARFI